MTTRIHFTDRCRNRYRYCVQINGRNVPLQRAIYILFARISASTIKGERARAEQLYPNEPHLANRYVYRLRRALGEDCPFTIDNSPNKGYELRAKKPTGRRAGRPLRIRFAGYSLAVEDAQLRSDLTGLPMEYFNRKARK